MEPWHTDGPAGGMIVALFDACQPPRFARTHRTEPLRFEAFRFFQHRTIPDQQAILLLGLPAGQLRIGSLEHKLLNLLRLPSLVMDERAQPFGASPTFQPIHGVAQFAEQ
jgi:hypothetical protein